MKRDEIVRDVVGTVLIGAGCYMYGKLKGRKEGMSMGINVGKMMAFKEIHDIVKNGSKMGNR